MSDEIEKVEVNGVKIPAERERGGIVYVPTGRFESTYSKVWLDDEWNLRTLPTGDFKAFTYEPKAIVEDPKPKVLVGGYELSECENFLMIAGEKVFEAVEAETCGGCEMQGTDMEYCCKKFKCIPSQRKDNRWVRWQKIEKTEKKEKEPKKTVHGYELSEDENSLLENGKVAFIAVEDRKSSKYHTICGGCEFKGKANSGCGFCTIVQRFDKRPIVWQKPAEEKLICGFDLSGGENDKTAIIGVNVVKDRSGCDLVDAVYLMTKLAFETEKKEEEMKEIKSVTLEEMMVAIEEKQLIWHVSVDDKLNVNVLPVDAGCISGVSGKGGSWCCIFPLHGLKINAAVKSFFLDGKDAAKYAKERVQHFANAEKERKISVLRGNVKQAEAEFEEAKRYLEEYEKECSPEKEQPSQEGMTGEEFVDSLKAGDYLKIVLENGSSLIIEACYQTGEVCILDDDICALGDSGNHEFTKEYLVKAYEEGNLKRVEDDN